MPSRVVAVAWKCRLRLAVYLRSNTASAAMALHARLQDKMLARNTTDPFAREHAFAALETRSRRELMPITLKCAGLEPLWPEVRTWNSLTPIKVSLGVVVPLW